MTDHAVLFDLDGTLLYTLEDLKKSVNYALDTFGYPNRSIDEIQAFIGNGIGALIKRSAPSGCTKETIAKLLDIFKPHYLEHMYDTTRPYDGVLDMMNEIHSNGYKTAIVSNKLDPAVKELNKKFFDGLTEMAVGTPVDKKKPNPESIFMCINNLNSSVKKSIYIGDTDVDIQTAHNAGIKCVGVSWGFRGRNFLKNHNCDYIIDNPSELLPLLKSINF